MSHPKVALMCSALLAGFVTLVLTSALTPSVTEGCAAAGDCAHADCRDGVCVPRCRDGLHNHAETDEDCGGGICRPCDARRRCQKGSDCRSAICASGRCQPATCDDGVQNQQEADVDCGGPCLPKTPCRVSAWCFENADCSSRFCRRGQCASQNLEMVDDLEDGDWKLLDGSARDGDWYLVSDGTGSAQLGPKRITGEPRRGSVFALHVAGSGFSAWGAGAGIDLHLDRIAKAKDSYDASRYQGISFWARAEKPLVLSVVFPDENTEPRWKRCKVCNRHWYAKVPIRTYWERFDIEFDDLVLDGGAVPAPKSLDAARLVSLQFRTEPGPAFDFWIDDLALLR